jgi:glycosyltransferase involved in cell wall biosynthesis
VHLVLVINSLGIGGAERVLIRLAHAWAKDGYRISFITFFQETANCYNLSNPDFGFDRDYSGDNPFATTESNRGYYGEDVFTTVRSGSGSHSYLDNIKLINLGEPKPKSNFLEQLFRISKRVIALRKLFNQLQPDLIVSFLVGANISVLLANWGGKFPVIVSERIDPAKHVIPNFYKKLRLITYKTAAAIVVQTNSVLNYFVPRLPEKLHKNIFVIPNFIKAPNFIKTSNIINPHIKSHNSIQSHLKSHINLSNSIKSSSAMPTHDSMQARDGNGSNNPPATTSVATKIISVGRLDQQKDQQLLIRAFAKLNNQDLQQDANGNLLTLTIYGEGELRGELEALIRQLNVQDRVFLPGVVKDVERALVESDLFVFPSKYEGFPNALCEAMSCGLPVIASNCSGNCDLIKSGQNGLLFTPGDVDGLAAAIQQLLNNPAERDKLAAAASRVVDSFSEAKILQQWRDVLQFVK